MDLLLSAFPPGRLSEIVGSGSSGGSSLLLGLLASRTAAGERVALVDLADSFDPEAARAAGADLRSCLWVRCGRRLAAALRAADLLVRCPGLAVVAVDLSDLPGAARPRIAPVACLRLQRAARTSGTILVFRAPCRVAGTAAHLVVSVERVRARWSGSMHPTRLAGLLSDIRLIRSRLPAASGPTDRWRVEWRP